MSKAYEVKIAEDGEVVIGIPGVNLIQDVKDGYGPVLMTDPILSPEHVLKICRKVYAYLLWSTGFNEADNPFREGHIAFKGKLSVWEEIIQMGLYPSGYKAGQVLESIMELVICVEQQMDILTRMLKDRTEEMIQLFLEKIVEIRETR